jgi:hypothetical protein
MDMAAVHMFLSAATCAEAIPNSRNGPFSLEGILNFEEKRLCEIGSVHIAVLRNMTRPSFLWRGRCGLLG